jgi:hypothetical protein
MACIRLFRLSAPIGFRGDRAQVPRKLPLAKAKPVCRVSEFTLIQVLSQDGPR